MLSPGGHCPQLEPPFSSWNIHLSAKLSGSETLVPASLYRMLMFAFVCPRVSSLFEDQMGYFLMKKFSVHYI